uniref:Uncharacterized protein n=1 Tax=Sphenodon punctatus TaxID=8508 RepID=A0A8D0GIK7_SPHPU
MANASPHSFRKMYLLSLDEDAFCEELHRSNRHDLCMKCGPDTIRYESEEDVPTLSLIAESEGDHFRQTPMEDEYVDRTPYGYLPLLSRSDSKPVSPFSEPVEVGEDDSLSHCFTGMESLEDLTCCCGADSFYGVDCVHASPGKCLQKSCHFDYSNMNEVESQDVNCSMLNPEGMSRCTGCGVPCRESPRKWNELLGAAAENPTVPFEAGTAARCTCGSDSPSVDESASTSDASTGDASSDGNDAKYQNTNRSASGANCNTSDLPPASGNVTGNSNSTFISNGQVMNFKGDIIVVYLSQNSQEGSAATGAADDNVGSPVQEENLNRCETFAGNVHQYKEKCAEVHSDCSELNSTEEYERTPGPVVQTESHNGLKPLCNGTSQPVQEEGKPGHFSKKALH